MTVKFNDLTEIQKDYLCNGCGGKGGIVTPPHAVFFKASCDHHDFNYFRGMTKTDRKKADDQFFDAMKIDVNDRIKGWWQRRRYFTWCRLYYLAVRCVGWKFFNWDVRPHIPTDDEIKNIL